MTQGITIILCTHNGETRLGATLSRLRSQHLAGTSWEVLLVDNASTDSTRKVALSCWGEGPVPLRITREAKLGLQCARERGLKEAKYDFIGFVDDDNWVAPDWVRVAYETLESDASLGALGSICEPVFEESEPEWFGRFHSSYAILTESDLQQFDRPPEYLCGAGLCLRKQAWTQLLRGGFRSLITDRVGRRLSGGGDNELTQAIRLAGWKVRVEPRLRLQHFMPGPRLRWEYLRRLQRGYAQSQVLLDAYSTQNLSMRLGFRPRLGLLWWCQAARSLLQLVDRPRAVLTALISDGKNQIQVIEVERMFGRMIGLLSLGKEYGRSRRRVRYAPWRLRRPDEYLPRQREVRV
jgi:cellulose synthase/poly-beta-1,6-N-acetylglucosamine synthase-like glycosyltransferase